MNEELLLLEGFLFASVDEGDTLLEALFGADSKQRFPLCIRCVHFTFLILMFIIAEVINRINISHVAIRVGRVIAQTIGRVLIVSAHVCLIIP